MLDIRNVYKTFAPGTVKNVVGEVEKVIAEFKEKIGD